MPRKQTTVLDKVEVSGNRSILQSAITAKLGELPPSIYLLVSETPDQKELWVGAKRYFEDIGAVLDGYFNGDAPPSLSHRNKTDSEGIWNSAWRYLAFYNMLYINWKAVKSVLHNKGAPPMPPTSSNGCTLTIPTMAFHDLATPLDVLLEVMQYKAIGIMAMAFSPHYEYVPGTISKRIKQGRSAMHTDATNDLRTQVRTEVKKWVKERPYEWLEYICALAAVNSKPKGVAKQAVSHYWKCCGEEQAWDLKMTRNRAKPERYTWKKGRLTANVRN